MDFFDALEQARILLQRHGRVSYRALKRQFNLDDACLDDLKFEIVQIQRLGADQDGEMLVWTGSPTQHGLPQPSGPDEEIRFQALLPAVIGLLQGERRVTHRTLKYVFGINDSLLAEICKELRLRRLAVDEASEVLVWTGDINTTTTAISLALPDPTPYGATASLEAPVEMPLDEQMTAPQSVRSALEAERRQLTVMFCDLVGSTDLAGRLDPEDLREVVRAYQQTAAEVIERYEGHIAQYLGDGLLVYFGYPVAHEDDAQRAVHTGLAIVDGMEKLNLRLDANYGVELAVRIGIHTGPVVVGEMGSGQRHENLALGETPNIAARLEGLAPPNTAVISPATSQLVERSFILEALGLHQLKGVSEPMQLYAVISSREADLDDHEAMLSGGFDALVGRDEEIGLLRRRWAQSKEALGQVVLISGEAGLGKSSLVEGLRAHVHQEGYTRIAFRCSPYTANSAMHPVIEHVQRLLGWQREDAAAAKLDKLEQALQPTRLPMQETVTLLAALLSLTVPEDRYPALTLSPQRQRQLTQDALVAWILEAAERQPVLAVWEDLHWADPSTLEMLGQLIEQAPTVSMMNVLAYRPEFAPPWPMHSHMTPITLNRLERVHIEALISRLAGGKRLPQELVTHVVAKTDGVPLYVEELTKMLLESELLEEDTGQYRLTGALSSASIPATLQDSLMARIDRIPEVRDVAQLSAVLGREFDYELLQALAEMDESTLQAGLNQLVRHELLYQRGRMPRAKFIFRHALIRDAAYQSLLRRTRQQYHKQVAALLETRFSDLIAMQPELVAHHYTEAGLDEKAIAYWQLAGQRESDRSSYEEAISHLTTGLSLLPSLPETIERQQQELDIQIALGTAWMERKGFGADEVKQAFLRAQTLCEQLRMDASPEYFDVLYGLRRVYAHRGLLADAQKVSEQCLHVAQELQDISRLRLSRNSLGVTLYQCGDFQSALSHLEQGIMYEHMYFQTNTAIGRDMPVCHLASTWVLWTCGFADQAQQRGMAALALVDTSEHPFSKAWTLSLLPTLAQYRGELELMYEWSETALQLAAENNFSQVVGWARTFRGWAVAMQGQLEEGHTQIRQGIDDLLASGSVYNYPYYLTLLAETQLKMRRLEEGLQSIDAALDAVANTGERCWEAEIYRLKGVFLLSQSPDNHHEADSCFYRALEISRHQQAKSLELRAAMSRARLWQSQGKRAEAHALLAPVYEWFTEGFDTADLKDATSLLDELAEGT